MDISGSNAQEIIKALKETGKDEVLNELMKSSFIPFELEDYFKNLEQKNEIEIEISQRIKEQHRLIGTGYNTLSVDMDYGSAPLWINGASWDCGQSISLPLVLQQDLKKWAEFYENELAPVYIHQADPNYDKRKFERKEQWFEKQHLNLAKRLKKVVGNRYKVMQYLGKEAKEIVEFTLSDGILKDENNKNISISDLCKRFNLEPNSSLDSNLYIWAKDIKEGLITSKNDPFEQAWINTQGEELARHIQKILPKNFVVSYKKIEPKNYSIPTIKTWLPETKEQLKNLIAHQELKLDTIDTRLITDMSGLFKGGIRKDFSGIDTWNVSNVKNMSSMFEGCKSLNAPIGKWKTLSLENISRIFSGCENFDQPLNEWHTYNIKNAEGAFYGCKNFNQSLNDWNTSNITNMNSMFYGCESFNQPLNNWNTKNVENISNMFCDCHTFNQPLDSWNTSKIKSMRGVFTRCHNFNQSLENWDMSRVIDASMMFYGCVSFDGCLNNWKLNSLKYAMSMFYKCYEFDQPLDKWELPNLLYANSMFCGCKNFNQSLCSWDSFTPIMSHNIFLGANNLENKNLPSWAGKKESIDYKENSDDDIGLDNGFNFLELKNIIDNGESYYYNDENVKEIKKENKYRPQNKSELNDLIYNKSVSLKDIDTSLITDMSYLFARLGISLDLLENNRTDFDGIETWDVSNVTNMKAMFKGCKNFNANISSWDVSNVTNMSEMFYFCSSFNQPLNSWNVSAVKDMSLMFYCCYNFNQPLDRWNVSSVENMGGMFHSCGYFNQPLVAWDVSNVKNMGSMFNSCYEFNQPLEAWDISSVENMPMMFMGADRFNQPLNRWAIGSGIDIHGMFWGCLAFDQPLAYWKPGNASIWNIFYRCESFNQCLDTWIENNEHADFIVDNILRDVGIRAFENLRNNIEFKNGKYRPKNKRELKILVFDNNIKLSDIDIANITDMSYLFFGSNRSDFSGIESWDVSKITNMKNMFFKLESFNEDISDWNVGNVTDMSNMFFDCVSFNQNISKWDISKVENINGILSGCQSFEQTLDEWIINYPNKADMVVEATLKDLSIKAFKEARKSISSKGILSKQYFPKYKWELKLLCFDNSVYLGNIDTSAITDMSDLFNGSNRKKFDGISAWDVSNVKNMSAMFWYCESFNENLNFWNVSNVEDMHSMFLECESFNSPLEAWNTSKVKDMGRMFSGCQSFNQPLNSWDVSLVENMNSMFESCTSFNQPLDNWDVRNVKNMESMFLDCASFDQSLYDWDVDINTKISKMLSGCPHFNEQLPPKVYLEHYKIFN